MKSAIKKDDIGLYNKKTGQVYEDTTLADYERQQREAKRQDAYKWTKHDDKFTFARMESIKEVISILTTAQCGLFLVLQTYVGYDGILRNAGLSKSKKTAMTPVDAMKVLGLAKKDSTFYDFWNRCLDHTLIIDNGDKTYSINGKYHFKGVNKGDNKVAKVFNTEVREMYKSIKPADLGLLYRLIPYIHLQTNTLCLNPYEDDPTKIQKLNQKQLCEMLGITKPTFSRMLNAKYDGKPIFAEVKVLGKKSYLINPWIFYRLEIAPNDSLVGQEVNSYQPDKTLRSIFSINE